MLMMLIHGVEAYVLLKNTEALLVRSLEIGLEVNADLIRLITWSCLEIRMQ